MTDQTRRDTVARNRAITYGRAKCQRCGGKGWYRSQQRAIIECPFRETEQHKLTPPPNSIEREF